MTFQDPAAPQTPPPPPPPPAAPASSNRNLMIVLAYLWLLALVPLLAEKDDQEVQWHAKNGLVLLVAEVIFWIAINIVNWIVGAATAGLGCFFTLLFPLFALGFLVLRVMCIMKGINGQRLVIPVLSDMVNKF
ncbi:MAG: hypothetical protein ACM3O7_07620 [Acidobacteriota bacterium]